MKDTGMFLYIFLLGYSLFWVSGQEPPAAGAIEAIQQASTRGTAQQSNQDEYLNSALYRMQNIQNISEFLSILTKNGNPVDHNEIFSNMTDDDGRLQINSGGRMAMPDECSPRDTTVRLTFDTSNPNLVYFPKCTKIERCGGCCASAHLECVPSYKEQVTYKVLKAEVPYPGSSHLVWNGDFAHVILERHVNCRVQCTLTADKCGPKKDFLDRQCECKCKAYERCQPPRVWDPEECECKCAEQLTCCKAGERCGLVFNKVTCECGIDVLLIGAGNNFTQEAMDAYNALINSSAANSTSQSLLADFIHHQLPSTIAETITDTRTTSTDTSATTTNAMTTTTDYDPCPWLSCPQNNIKFRNAEGRCSCRRRLRHGQMFSTLRK